MNHNSARHYNIASERSFGTAPASSISSDPFYSQYGNQTIDFIDEVFNDDEENRRMRRERVQQYLDEHLSEVSLQGDSSVISDIMATNEEKSRQIERVVDNLVNNAMLEAKVDILVDDSISGAKLDEQIQQTKQTGSSSSPPIQQTKQTALSSSSSQPMPFGVNPVEM